MANERWAQAAQAKRFLKQQYDQQVVQQSGAASSDYGDAGPPYWNRSSWEAFRAQYGFYPYGMQDGAMVYPSSFDGAPDWVYELMNMRKPPVSVAPPPS
jgi:hypothetical protein